MKNIFYLLALFNVFSIVNANNMTGPVINSMSGKIPPGEGYREIALELAIVHIYDINLDHQTVRLSGFFRQSWNDSRMIGNHYDTVDKSGRKFYLMNKMDALWFPDTFISNSIEHIDRASFANDPHGAYHYLRVYTDGEVLYSQMVELKVRTKMNLKYYPFNVLKVTLVVESYGYVDDTLRFSAGVNPNNKVNNISLELEFDDVPGYIVDRRLTNTKLTKIKYSPGWFSRMELEFQLVPNNSTLFILTIPSLLLIVISSFIFWMDVKKKLSERLSLGITAMLADFALSFSLPVPNTPEHMYIREYINISYIFIGFSIFFTFMEYIIVSYVYNIKSNIDKSYVEKIRNEEKPDTNPLKAQRNKKKLRYKGIVSKSVQNLKKNFVKLLDINDLLQQSLIEYMNNSLPEEPVMPIKAAIGTFYLSCWITYMIAHIIPGGMIIEKAKLNIEYHNEAIEYFPFIMYIGVGISFLLSMIAFYIQFRAREKWSIKIDNKDDIIDEHSSIYKTETNLRKDSEINLKEETIEKLKHRTFTFGDVNMNTVENNILRLNKEINDDFDKMTECIDNTIEIANKGMIKRDAFLKEKSSEDSDEGIIITVVERDGEKVDLVENENKEVLVENKKED